LGFEDSTINADEVSYENHEAEENETNRYIELLKYDSKKTKLKLDFLITSFFCLFSQIQGVKLLRDEIEQIDVYQLRNHATSYSKDFG